MAVTIDGEPAPDGEYRTEDGKVIVVADGVVAEIRDDAAEVAPEENPEIEELRKENAALKSQVAELSAQVETLSRQSAAKPAHEEVQTAERPRKTGVKGLDRLAELMARK
jgi:polyhydroxyalkanoate synthesis regulator phasin